MQIGEQEIKNVADIWSGRKDYRDGIGTHPYIGVEDGLFCWPPIRAYKPIVTNLPVPIHQFRTALFTIRPLALFAEGSVDLTTGIVRYQDSVNLSRFVIGRSDQTSLVEGVDAVAGNIGFLQQLVGIGVINLSFDDETVPTMFHVVGSVWPKDPNQPFNRRNIMQNRDAANAAWGAYISNFDPMKYKSGPDEGLEALGIMDFYRDWNHTIGEMACAGKTVYPRSGAYVGPAQTAYENKFAQLPLQDQYDLVFAVLDRHSDRLINFRAKAVPKAPSSGHFARR